MSWLYSIVLAGLLFSSESKLPNYKNYNDTNANVKKVIQLDETERFEQTYPLNANGRVSISNINGSITVETWDRNEVKLIAVKTANDKEGLAAVEIKIDARPDHLEIETDYENWKGRNNGERWRKNDRMQVEYQLTVPRGAVLDEIETVNGSVSIANATNIVKASTVNGQVKASNLRGTTELSTVNGTVDADFDQLQTGSRIKLDTVNGKVNLVIPSDANATIKADTVNGSISNEFGLPVRKGEYVGKDLYGRIGSGDVQIRLDSVNGGLSILRKKDGKNPNPAVNLLPAKGKDDDVEWEDDNDGFARVDKVKVNKEISKAIAESRKTTAEAMKEAEKEMAKIKPELDKINAEAFKKAAEAINTEEIQKQVTSSMERQREILSRLADANWVNMPLIEKKSDTLPVKGIPKITIQAKGCSISVRGWDKPEVQYQVTRFARNRIQPPVEFKESHTDATVNIEVVNTDQDAREGNFGDEFNRVRVEVFVPKKSNLRILTNGEIRLEGVTGDIELNGNNEAINVRDIDGKLHLTSSNGIVRIIGFKGDLESRIGDGEVYLEGEFKSICAKAGDGKYILTLPENANATLVTNTQIELDAVEAEADKFKVGNLLVDKAEENTWKVGLGEAKYNFSFVEGNLVLRDNGQIQAK